MAVVLETHFIFCSPHMSSFKKISAIVDMTTPSCLAHFIIHAFKTLYDIKAIVNDGLYDFLCEIQFYQFFSHLR